VLHACDANYAVRDITYRRCCNPTHLFLGTDADNVADMDAKGRRVNGDHRGTRNGRAKLTEDDVRTIRRRYADGGITMQQLADEFGVAHLAVRKVIRRMLWQHVD
jgi:hypothetical protein